MNRMFPIGLMVLLLSWGGGGCAEPHCERFAEVLAQCHDPDIIGRQFMLHGHSPFDYQQRCEDRAHAAAAGSTYFRDNVACLVASDGDCDFASRCLLQVVRRDEEDLDRHMEEVRRYRRLRGDY